MNQPEFNISLKYTGEGMKPPTFDNAEDERLHLKRMLTASFRLFGKFGFDEGAAGHITVRDPQYADHFWVNPYAVSFKQVKMSDLLLVNHHGDIVEGNGILNTAAFAIHSQIHAARPDILSAAHAHSIYGKTWAMLGRPLDPLTQDACAFYKDHVVFEDYTGVVLDESEGLRIAAALGDKKAAILQNHGLLTVGTSVEAAVWWYITMERSCQAQLLAESAGIPKLIRPDIAQITYNDVGTEMLGWYSFQPLLHVIVAEQPDMFD